MWLRRAFYHWLVPAAFLLPLWLLIGWGAFDAGGWAFVWVLFIAIPSILVGQLILTLLVRSRASVRSAHALSWWDVAGFGLWHSLTIALGFFAEAWWGSVMVLTIVVGVGMFWLVLWELLRETRATLQTYQSAGTYPAAQDASGADQGIKSSDADGVYIISESHTKNPGQRNK